MDSYIKQVLEAWTTLKQKKYLTEELLNVSADVLSNSTELQKKVMERNAYIVEYEQKRKALEKLEKSLADIYYSASGKAVEIARRKLGLDLKIESFSRQNPKSISIICILPLTHEVVQCKSNGSWEKLVDIFRHKLKSGGYPVDEMSSNWIGLYSQEECDKVSNGNWYYFFK